MTKNSSVLCHNPHTAEHKHSHTAWIWFVLFFFSLFTWFFSLHFVTFSSAVLLHWMPFIMPLWVHDAISWCSLIESEPLIECHISHFHNFHPLNTPTIQRYATNGAFSKSIFPLPHVAASEIRLMKQTGRYCFSSQPTVDRMFASIQSTNIPLFLLLE